MGLRPGAVPGSRIEASGRSEEVPRTPQGRETDRRNRWTASSGTARRGAVVEEKGQTWRPVQRARRGRTPRRTRSRRCAAIPPAGSRCSPARGRRSVGTPDRGYLRRNSAIASTATASRPGKIVPQDRGWAPASQQGSTGVARWRRIQALVRKPLQIPVPVGDRLETWSRPTARMASIADEQRSEVPDGASMIARSCARQPPTPRRCGARDSDGSEGLGEGLERSANRFLRYEVRRPRCSYVSARFFGGHYRSSGVNESMALAQPLDALVDQARWSPVLRIVGSDYPPAIFNQILSSLPGGGPPGYSVARARARK